MTNELKIQVTVYLDSLPKHRWKDTVKYTYYADDNEVRVSYPLERVENYHDRWHVAQNMPIMHSQKHYGFIYLFTDADLEVIRIWRDSVMLGL